MSELASRNSERIENICKREGSPCKAPDTGTSHMSVRGLAMNGSREGCLKQSSCLKMHHQNGKRESSMELERFLKSQSNLQTPRSVLINT